MREKIKLVKGRGQGYLAFWVLRVQLNEKCEQFMSKDYSFNPFYSIVLPSISLDASPINYHEILNTGATSSTDGGGIPFFSGRGSFGNPDPELGSSPGNSTTPR